MPRLVCRAVCLAALLAVGVSGMPHDVRSAGAAEGDYPPVFPTWPFVIQTWPWTQAADAAYAALTSSKSTTPSLDAIVAGLSTCEEQQCGGTVGFGGSPDEAGETTLDALIINGVSLEVGAVGALRGVKNAIGVARAVMDYTSHTMLVGSQATDFALNMGFPPANLSTPASLQQWQQWQQQNCQPNMRKNVLPDPTQHCGPYKPTNPFDTDVEQAAPARAASVRDRSAARIDEHNHDTIGMVVIDAHGNMAAGASTNGMAHKVPGRVGDGPIAGSGAWVDSDWGGCAATGDGDIMMRFQPCYQAVQNLRAGHTPRQAAEDALGRIERFFSFSGALVVIDRQGNYGAASWDLPFSYAVRTGNMSATEVIDVVPGDWLHTKPVGDANRRNKGSRKQREQDKHKRQQWERMN